MNNTVSTEQLVALRNQGIIMEDEIAIIEGDILLAKNVLTESKRIVGKADSIINENKRRVLKG